VSTEQLRQDLPLAKASLQAILDPAVKNAFGEVFALLEGCADAIDEIEVEIEDGAIGIEPERALLILAALDKAQLIVTAFGALIAGPLGSHVSDEDKTQIQALLVDGVASFQQAAIAVNEVTLQDIEDDEGDE
jgi:hypothetical protein